MSDIFGVKEVSDFQILDYNDKHPLATINYAQSQQQSVEGERTYITGGRGNQRLLAFDGNKTSTMQITIPLVDAKLIALLSGDTAESAVKDVYQKDVLPVSAAHTVTLTQTPLAGASIYVYASVGSRQDIGDEFTVVETAPTAQQYSIAGNILTFADTVAENTMISVFYQYATLATARTVRVLANKFPPFVTLVGDGLWRDAADTIDKAVKLTVYRAQPQTNFTLSSSAGNDATTLELNFDMYSEIVDGEPTYSDMTIIEED